MRSRYQTRAVCGLLLLAVGLVFGQTPRYGFVNFDDDLYVFDNPQVPHGLTAEGFSWAFRSGHAGNWHPLTWISLMLDGQLYGLSAGGYHLTNVLLHAATAVVLFLVLQQMTGCRWQSALVAGLFAIHPLRAESVAWVTERKDVLSGLFFVATLGAYVRYVRSPFSLANYLLLVVAFALGLMAKPMLVTLPLLLLLLDYWPLRRMARAAADGLVAGGGWSNRFSISLHLIREKVPLLLVTAVFCVLTYWVQGNASALDTNLSVFWRIANALVSYVTYLGQLFCPVGLAALYPHLRETLPVGKTIGALVLLVCISAGVLACWRRCPYLVVGWLWYLGMFVPVIGLIQQGSQARADRFTYLPQIGLCIALAWGVGDVCRRWPHRRQACGAAAALALAVLMGCAWRQTSFWHDGESLWTHTLACTSQNYAAHCNLGYALLGRKKFDEALVQYQKAEYLRTLGIGSDDAENSNNLGLVLQSLGRSEEAMAQYRKALRIEPGSVPARYNLGRALQARGRIEEAIAQYQQVLQFKPDQVDARNNLGTALQSRGRIAEAIAQFEQALKLKPDCVEGHYNLGNALAGCGRLDEAISQFEQALTLAPNDAKAHTNLGAALQLRGKPDEAMAQFRRVLEIEPRNVKCRDNLGKALASRGQFDQAILQFEQALTCKPDDADAHNSLAWLLATCPQAALRNGAEAIEHAQRANRLTGDKQLEVLHTLAAAYAEAGRFPEALATVRQALDLATQQNNRALADVLRARIALYEARKPYRQTAPDAPRLPPKP